MTFRAGVLIVLCAGSAVANAHFAAALDSSSDEVQPLRFVISLSQQSRSPIAAINMQHI